MMQPIRTRFAPSPTGFLHVGGIRTALFAWLVARQSGGQFVLRFEDTDQKREVAGARQHLIDSLRALGLVYDEGPDIGGAYAPYVQSQRLDHYRIWAQRLIDAGRAYADPYSSAEVDAFRQQARTDKQAFLYRHHRPEQPPVWDGSQPLRFRSEPQPYKWHDEVMGDLSTGAEVIDDFVLIKSDGFPTYNFAHIVDDAEMHIDLIIRGQEFLASVPNYLNLYEALELTPPRMATVPHILGPDGNKKLSKRDGAKDVLDYLRDGFHPDALINFIASLGWNDATEQEIFSRQQLIDSFALDHVQRSGARFDERRLEWMNGSYLRSLAPGDIYTFCQDFWPVEALESSDDYKRQVLSLVQERLKFGAELPELTRFFFVDLPLNPELISGHKQLKKLSTDELRTLLLSAQSSLSQSDFSVDDLSARLNHLLEISGQKPAVLFSLIRIATTQAAASPGLADTLAVLGPERSLRRLQAQLDALTDLN
ncbi:MAG: glutamate--tRNA ligase [Candidatus Saccharimonadales bacterium]